MKVHEVISNNEKNMSMALCYCRLLNITLSLEQANKHIGANIPPLLFE